MLGDLARRREAVEATLEPVEARVPVGSVRARETNAAAAHAAAFDAAALSRLASAQSLA